MNKINLNKLRDKSYKTAYDHGFHDKDLSNEHYLCLVISELMEAVEADRKSKKSNRLKFEKEFSKYPALVEESKRFKCAFEKFIKDTVEDELADAVIRLFDLAGARNISFGIAVKDIVDDCIDDMAESCKDETFTESIYAISTLPVRYSGLYDFPTVINDMVLSIFGLAKHIGINLFWHIDQKMKYNELREKRHGKKY
ncbi:hypothetical protein OCV73_00135 [Barnesiella propionica]|uniref:hypothetical protein n=1 Tax=Barnesiella propionica TaxID=2981781 RepID=UPI0011C98B8A|nr:hypothetical protein [Barnesiella propionica]MCU6767370.1 hypothetical protein [Barnesiella propionica]